MAKIESLDGPYYFKHKESKKTKKKEKALHFSSVIEARAESFLPDLDISGHGENLEALLDEVHTVGDALKENQSLENIRVYKEAVKAFLQFVMQRMLKVEQKESGINILKRKRFTRIQIIDQRLERLVADILQNQAEQLDILNRIDEINGLLVNLIT